MDIALPLLIAIVILLLDIKSTLLLLRDSFLNPKQRILQLAFVWFLPVLGAIVVLAIHRSDEKHSGKYIERSGQGDDFCTSGNDVYGHFGGTDGD